MFVCDEMLLMDKHFCCVCVNVNVLGIVVWNECN